MLHDRRKHPRILIMLPCGLRIRHQWYFGTTRNLSMSGISVKITEGILQTLYIGANSHILLTINGMMTDSFKCRVQRIEDHNIALQFMELSQTQENILRAIISGKVFSQDAPPKWQSIQMVHHNRGSSH